MNLGCYILDDEQPALDLLRRYVERTPGLYCLGSATSPLEALAFLNDHEKPDILFCDIRMPELSGLELARLVNTRLVFTTSFRDHAPEAFEAAAMDYLLKPIPYERFLSCMQRIRQQVPSMPEELFVKTGQAGQLARVTLREVVLVSALQNYVEITTTSGRLVTLCGISQMESLLPAARFSRIHRSHIISHAHIRQVCYDEVELTTGQRLTIGRNYREAFMAKLSVKLLPSRASRDV